MEVVPEEPLAVSVVLVGMQDMCVPHSIHICRCVVMVLARRRFGLCEERTVLLLGLCKTFGIPSRILSGHSSHDGREVEAREDDRPLGP